MRRSLLILTLFVLTGHGCAVGLDFDGLRDERCSEPYFDVYTRSEYCTGLLQEGESFSPVDIHPSAGRAYIQRAEARDDRIAYAALAIHPDGASVAVGGATLGEDGGFKDEIGFVGFDFGIADPDAQAAYATDVTILQADPPAILASFAELGLIYVEWNELERVVRRQYFPGLRIPVVLDGEAGTPPDAPHQRACSSGVCTVADGSRCLDHADCGSSSYCDDGKCAPLPGCSAINNCDAGLSCALTERMCRIECGQSSDCPYSLTCDNATCGGRRGCSSEISFECDEGLTCDEALDSCVQRCESEESHCGGGQECVVSNERQICGPDSVVGTCSTDDDCDVGWAMGLATFDYGNGSSGLAIASAWEGLRFGLYVPGGGITLGKTSKSLDVCALTDQEPDQCYDEGELALTTDVVAHDSVLYAAMSGSEDFIGVSLVDFRHVADEGELDLNTDVRFQSLADTETCPSEASAGIPIISELLIVDGRLVVIEGGLLGRAMTELGSRIRIFDLDPGSTRNFLREVDCIPLGDAEMVSVTQSKDDPSVWVIAVTEGITDGAFSGEFQIISVTGLGEVPSQHIHSQEIPLPTDGYQSLVPVLTAGRLFIATASGVTEYKLDLNAERD